MADAPKSGGGLGIGWFFIGLAALFVMWLVSGGPERASKDDKFIHEPQGIQTGNTYDKPVTLPLIGETI